MSTARSVWILAVFATATLSAAGQVSSSPHGTLPDKMLCTDCHSEGAWSPLRSDLKFKHDRDTGFRLVGSHDRASCASCHLDLDFGEPRLAADDCASCHVDVHQGNFVQNCSSCHNSWAFQDVDGIQVHQATTFPLTGAHVQITCESCHVDDTNGAFSPLATECSTCHADAFESAGSFDHVALGLTDNCDTCHETTSWAGTPFDHLALSDGFELVGSHSALACASCHTVPGFGMLFNAGGPTDCFACHESDYSTSHVADGFEIGTFCADCHGTDTWTGADFSHVVASGGFELVGAHAPLACESCHVSPGFNTIFSTSDQTECVACHESDYQTAHVAEGYETGTMCMDCHTTDTWSGIEFDHLTASNGFELVGAHVPLSCESCHVVPGYGGIFQAADQNDCVACHQSDYQTSHLDVGYETGTMCADCHGSDAWLPATFDHMTASNGFELVGAHVPLSCESCHVVPGYGGIFQATDQNDCEACHQSDYQTSHLDVGYETGTMCADCHGSDAWLPATFDHVSASNGFELVGAHVPLACETCHVVPGYGGIFQTSDQNDCVACHQSDYQTGHIDTAFDLGPVCSSCHTNETWTGSTFDHDGQYFPIDSGPHREKWNDCQSCHEVPGDYTLYTCLSCHEHNRTSMDEKHREERDYVYESTSCFSCHPDGRS